MAQGQKPNQPQTGEGKKPQDRGEAQGGRREEQMGEKSPDDLEQERIRGTQLDQQKRATPGNADR